MLPGRYVITGEEPIIYRSKAAADGEPRGSLKPFSEVRVYKFDPNGWAVIGRQGKSMAGSRLFRSANSCKTEPKFRETGLRCRLVRGVLVAAISGFAVCVLKFPVPTLGNFTALRWELTFGVRGSYSHEKIPCISSQIREFGLVRHVRRSLPAQPHKLLI
jgi:hypothetical protein